MQEIVEEKKPRNNQGISDEGSDGYEEEDIQQEVNESEVAHTIQGREQKALVESQQSSAPREGSYDMHIESVQLPKLPNIQQGNNERKPAVSRDKEQVLAHSASTPAVLSSGMKATDVHN